MVKNKLPIAAGKYESDAYADQMVSDFMKKHGVSLNSIVKTDDLKHRARKTLLGNKVGTELIIEDKDHAEEFIKTIAPDVKMVKNKPTNSDDKKKIEDNLKIIMNDGLFIIINTPATSNAVKTIINIINGLGEGFDDPSKDKMGEAGKILSDCKIGNDVKNALLNYLGEDYEILLPVVKNIMALPIEDQKSMSVEDVMLRVPNPPGKILPWGDRGMDECAMDGDMGGALNRLDRVLAGGMLPIMFSTWFLNTVHRSVMMLALTKQSGDHDKAAHALGYGGIYTTKGRPDPYNGKGGYPARLAYERAVAAERHGATLKELLKLDGVLAQDLGIIRGQLRDRKMTAEDAITDMVAKTSVVYGGGKIL